MTATRPEVQSPTRWEDEIRSREAQAQTAFLAVDVNTLEEIFTDTYCVNSPLQRVVRKAELLELLRAGRIRHKAFSATIEHISRAGDTVVVMGQDRVVDPPDDAVTVRRFINIWRLEQGVWRAIARQATAISRTVPQP